MPKQFLIIYLCFGAFFITPLKADQLKRPNILFIAVDDLRPELGCYGAKQVKTPNIDAMAKEAVLFENSYCNVAVCGASRASLLTGVRPITNKRFTSYKSRAGPIDGVEVGAMGIGASFPPSGTIVVDFALVKA